MIKALINGNWKEISKEQLQFGTGSYAFKTGLYETFRTLNHNTVFLDEHVNRLLRSAWCTGLIIHYSKHEILEMVDTVISNFPESNQRVRILADPDNLILYTSSLDIDDSIYDGVSAITVFASRSTPHVKTTDYEVCLSAWEKAKKSNCFEAILVDNDGYVYEGSKSNVFWVTDGKLLTRQDQVLPGVTRQTIISKSSIPAAFGQLNKNDFDQIDELFITNSGSGIVPVNKVNKNKIGSGVVGKLTRKLLSDYNMWIKL